MFGGDHFSLSNGRYNINNLIPGGVYIIQAMWLEGTPQYVETICRRTQLPYNMTENKSLYSSKYITARLENQDRSCASNNHFDAWLARMDSVYLSLKDLTGYVPYGGRKIEINSSRVDLSSIVNMPDGENYWEIIYGWSGNPVEFSQPHYNSLMKRLSIGDWGDLPIHELSHDFDKDIWVFDAEALSFFKMYYVLSDLNATVYRSDVDTYGDEYDPWYTGTEYYDFLTNDCYIGYIGHFDEYKYSSGGMAAILCSIQKQIGWEPVKKTFRYFSSLNSSQIPSNSGEKLKLFLTKLKDYSGKNVLNYISGKDTAIISNKFNITLEYIDAPYPIVSEESLSGSSSEVNVPSGSYNIYQFKPTESAIYYIYTSPFAGSGVSNDTYLEVYTDSSLSGTPIASNDDYDGGRFSKVSISLTEGTTYYVKVRHYNNGQLHAELNITKNIPIIELTNDGYN